MNTLIFNGSPRKDGDTAFVIKELKQLLKGKVKIVNTYFSSISPCTDCRYCWEKAGCCINDNMQTIYNDIKECDNIVIASPLYFSELSGSLLNVMSRLQTFYTSKRFFKIQQVSKAKKGALILCGGGSSGAEKAESTAHILFQLMNADIVKSIYSLNTDKIPSKEGRLVKKQIIELAEILNS